MSFVTRLIGLVAEVAGDGAPDGDERLAVAALLVHVARVDGRMGAAERVTLLRLLHERFGLPQDAAERLVERADALDREVDDIATLIEMMGHGIDEPDRRRLLDMARTVAAADGAIQEFEDDLLWRLEQLLGLAGGDDGPSARAAAGEAGPA